MVRGGILWLASAFVVAAAGAAPAADMLGGPFERAPEIANPRMEFGNGWYLRGDTSLTFDTQPQLNADLSFSGSKKKQTGWAIGVGAGYQVNDWLRFDVTYDYRKPLSSNATGTPVVCPYGLTQVNDIGGPIGFLYNPTNTCVGRSQGKLKRADLMANAYFDLGTWSGLTPYVGAGVGVSYNESQGSVNYFKTSDGTPYGADLSGTGGVPPVWRDIFGNIVVPNPAVTFAKQNWDRYYSGKTYQLAWALMAGLAWNIAERTKLDVGYRYISRGSLTGVAAGAGGGPGTVFKSALTTQEVRVGVRYAIE